MTRRRQKRVMIVDDDQTTLLLAKTRLERDGFVVQTRDNPLGTSNAIRAFAPDLVLVDVGMPAMDGDRLVGLIRRGRAEVKVALYSDRPPAELAALTAECGAEGFIAKSDTTRLGRLVKELLED